VSGSSINGITRLSRGKMHTSSTSPCQPFALYAWRCRAYPPNCLATRSVDVHLPSNRDRTYSSAPKPERYTFAPAVYVSPTSVPIPRDAKYSGYARDCVTVNSRGPRKGWVAHEVHLCSRQLLDQEDGRSRPVGEGYIRSRTLCL
jgi:hypothetical protein